MTTKHAVSAQKLVSRYTDLLDVAVTEHDGLGEDKVHVHAV